MQKRFSALFLILAILVLLPSCDSSLEYWSDLYTNHRDVFGTVDIVKNENTLYDVKYQDKIYYRNMLFSVSGDSNNIQYEGDVLVSWESLPFGLSYLDKYYSYTRDNPVFIYIPRLQELYLSEDYDYQNDTFVIEGTDYEFVFSEGLLKTDFDYDWTTVQKNGSEIVLYSKQYPRVRVSMIMFCDNGVWYAGGAYENFVFSVSNELLDLLMKS